MCRGRNDKGRYVTKKIRCLGFAVVELAEYLDTHADDKRALALHKEYANELRELSNKYQKKYMDRLQLHFHVINGDG